jgi:hypothetical protein
VKVLVVSVLGSIASEKVASTLAVAATPVAPSAGATLLTVGAVASMVRLSALEAEEVFPAASLAVAVIEWVPSLRALLGVKLQLPALSAVVVPSDVLPS